MLLLAAISFLAVGVVLGMLGGGGAILTVPILVYALGIEPKDAIATSLLIVGATSFVGTTTHARAGRVRWKIGATFGAATMVGAFGGAQIARHVAGNALLLGFGIVMVVTATSMLRPRAAVAERRTLRLAPALGLGAAVGVVSGLVGAGGGFLIVPALTLFAGLAIHEAVGTSLFVISLQSLAGFVGHAPHAHIVWPIALVALAAAVVGSVAGASAGNHVPAAALRRMFAWLVIAMGIFIVLRQLAAHVGLPVLTA
jgi:uncharacterized membrane protein YfcA